MAGNQDSGRVLAFKLSEKQLEKAIAQYKQDLADGKFPRPSWPHLCARLGYTESEVAEVIQRGIEVKGAMWGVGIANYLQFGGRQAEQNVLYY